MEAHIRRYWTLKPIIALSKIFASAMLLLALNAQAAKPLGPPIAHLSSSANPLVSATVADTSEPADGWLTLNITEVHFNGEGDSHAKAGETIRVRIKDDGFEMPKAGDKVIAVYSSVRKHPSLRDERIVDPEGPRIVDIRGIDTNAVFAYSKNLVTAFQIYRDLSVPNPPHIVSLKQKNLAYLTRLLYHSDDTRTVGLMVEELLLRDDLIEAAQDSHIQTILLQLDKLSLPVKFENMLLETAYKYATSQIYQEKLHKILRKILEQQTPEFDLASHNAALVINTLKGMRKLGSKQDIKLIAKFLPTNSPPVFDSVIKTIKALDQASLAKVLEQFKPASDSHPDIKRAYENARNNP